MSLSKKLQLKVEECIDSVADEFDFDVSHYPSVYYLGKNFSFKHLGLTEKEYEESYKVKKARTSGYLWDKGIVFIGSDELEQISEEAGHFLHRLVSGPNEEINDLTNIIAFDSLREMLAFFSSKLIVPERVNTFAVYPDKLIEPEKFEKFVSENPHLDRRKFFTYKQGYGLGELLFDSYISGIVSKGTIRNLFLEDFKGDNSPVDLFHYLKFDLLNFRDN